MMPVRKLRPEEKIEALKIQSIAFVFESDFSTAQSNPEQFRKGYETLRGCFDDSGKLLSCLSLIPFEVRFDGNTVKMGGIGGVATLPEARNKGNIRRLMRYCFEEMLENQQIFSYLYPFSHPYYRKFGYESCYRRAMISVPLTSFRHLEAGGEVRQYQPSESYDAIRDIYNRFIADKNLAIVRDRGRWENLLKKDPYKTRQYTYVWHDPEGNPGSYIIFKGEGQWQTFDMQVLELAWTDYESLAGILGFLYRFSPKYRTFKCPAGEFFKIDLFLTEPYDLKLEFVPYGMNRIVDLKRVLELMAYPEGKGQIAVDVRDAFLEWNDGIFLVSWENGKAEVTKKDCPADMSCGIEVLTQLITGYAGLDDYFGRGDLKVHSQEELLFKVFKRKKLYINDYF